MPQLYSRVNLIHLDINYDAMTWPVPSGDPYETVRRLVDRPEKVSLYCRAFFDDAPFPTVHPYGRRGRFDQAVFHKYGTYWTEQLLLKIRHTKLLRDKFRALWVDHPRLGWNHDLHIANRHLPEVKEMMNGWLDRISDALGCPVYQFGLPTNSLVLYQWPLQAGVTRLPDPYRGGAWVNIPGQYAFNRWTTSEDFLLHLHLCKRAGVQDICLWANPAEPVTEARQLEVKASIIEVFGE